MSLNERINNDFAYHAVTGEQQQKLVEVRELCRKLAHRLTELVPDGREIALALTSLECVMLWSNAGISRESPVPVLPSPVPEPPAVVPEPPLEVAS